VGCCGLLGVIGSGYPLSSLLPTEVIIGFVDPVGPWRIEHIKIDCIHDGLCLVRHVGRDGQHFAGVDHDLLAIDPELERSFQNVSNLLVVMAVQGHDAALLQKYSRQHDALSYDEMALQQGV